MIKNVTEWLKIQRKSSKIERKWQQKLTTMIKSRTEMTKNPSGNDQTPSDRLSLILGPSRDLPRPIFLDFGPQLGGFWIPTWWILRPNDAFVSAVAELAEGSWLYEYLNIFIYIYIFYSFIYHTIPYHEGKNHPCADGKRIQKVLKQMILPGNFWPDVLPTGEDKEEHRVLKKYGGAHTPTNARRAHLWWARQRLQNDLKPYLCWL